MNKHLPVLIALLTFGSFDVVGDDYQYWHCKHQKFDTTYFYIQNESSKNFENDQYYLEEPPKIFGSRGYKIFFISELDNNFNSTHLLESAYIQDSRNELRISISEEVFDWNVPPVGRMKKVETDLVVNLEGKYLDLVDWAPYERTRLKCSNLTEKIFEAAYSSFMNKHEKELLE